MRFVITSKENRSTFGDVFFEEPKFMMVAEKKVWNLCNARLEEETKFHRQLQERFEREFQNMHKTQTAFHFLLLREIAQISLEEGYPVDMLGDAAGSVIAYLLGITGQDTLPYYMNQCAEELVWGSESDPQPPDFSLGIAAEVRPFIHEKLERKYGDWISKQGCYRRISLTDLVWCQSLGEL